MERSTQAPGERATAGSAERLIRQIRSKTRQRISAEDKISLKKKAHQESTQEDEKAEN